MILKPRPSGRGEFTRRGPFGDHSRKTLTQPFGARRRRRFDPLDQLDDIIVWHSFRSQLRNRRVRPDFLRPVEQRSAAIYATGCYIIAPDLMRDIRPRCFDLAFLLLILGGFLVINVTDPGQCLQAARPDQLAPPVEYLRIFGPEATRLLVALVAGCGQQLRRRSPRPAPAFLAL